MAVGRSAGLWIVRASVASLLAVLCFLAGFSVVTQSRSAAFSQRVDDANAVTNTYQDARFWVGQEESLERKYRLEPVAAVRRAHQRSEQALTADLTRLLRLDPSPANRRVAQRLLGLNAAYIQASDKLARAVDAHRTALVIRLDHAVVDPVFGLMQKMIYANAASTAGRSLTQTQALRRNDSEATDAIAAAFAIGVALLLGLGVLIAYSRRRLDTALRSELTRLAEVAITDPLTRLRNHRAFHEDLENALQRAGRHGVPVSLVMLDLDKLKEVNDTHGHQAGDDRLRALADALRRSGRGSDRAYRIGGDEFAVILDGTRAWNAIEFVERLRSALAAEPRGTA